DRSCGRPFVLETQLNIPWSRSAQDDSCALNSPAKRTQTSGASAIDERVSNPRRQASRFVTGKNLQFKSDRQLLRSDLCRLLDSSVFACCSKTPRGEPLPTLNGILMFPAMCSGRSVVESC